MAGSALLPEARTSPSNTLLLGWAAVERLDALAEELKEPLGVDVDAHVGVRVVAGAVPEVDDRAAAAELRLAVHVHVAVERLHDPGPQHLRDGDCVVDGAPSVLRLPVVLDEEVVQLGDERAAVPEERSRSTCDGIISALWVTSSRSSSPESCVEDRQAARGDVDVELSRG